MIEVRRFGLEVEDFLAPDRWLKAHGVPELKDEPYAETMLIAVEDDVLIAIGGMHGTQNIGVMDWLVTNPATSCELRSQAIDQIRARLEAHAKELGMHAVVAWTEHDSIVKRLESAGWTVPEATFLVKRL